MADRFRAGATTEGAAVPQCGWRPGEVQLELDAAAAGRQPRAEPSVVGAANFSFRQSRPVVSATQVRWPFAPP